MRVLVLMAVLGAVGCQRSAPRVAKGSGYGLGIPRTAFTFGRPPQTDGNSTGSFAALEQKNDYRPRRPLAWPPLAGARWPLTWTDYRGYPRVSQYRGNPSKR
jgi:hypothetical protein